MRLSPTSPTRWHGPRGQELVGQRLGRWPTALADRCRGPQRSLLSAGDRDVRERGVVAEVGHQPKHDVTEREHSIETVLLARADGVLRSQRRSENVDREVW